VSFDRRIRAILERSGKLDEEQLEQLQKISERDNAPIAQVVTEKGFLSEREYLSVICRASNLPPVDLEYIEADPEILDIVDVDTAESAGVFPLAKIGGSLTVAVSNPFDLPTLDHLSVTSGCELRPVVASYTAIKRAVANAFRKGDQAMQELLSDDEKDIQLKEANLDDDSLDLTGGDEDNKIIRAANMILYESVNEKVSDIHIEPFERQSRVRYRLDGVLKERHTFSKGVHAAIISRLKIMGNLDIAEKRRPQDGKFQIRVNGRQVDLRLSILPVVHGEKAVLRLLDSSNLVLNLGDLGFEPECLEAFSRGIRHPYGMILVTGPTGSGKSTTLYSAVNELLSEENNFVTVEDPVEYQLEGVNQVPVNVKRGLTFAAALRSILRQDPDTVMIGEIRDKETLDIGIKAALTGHLVLSTLHTNDAPSAVTRMIQMGIDPFLVASSVILVAAQRLGRKLCDHCKKKVDAPRERLVDLGMTPDEIEGAVIYQANGCRRCAQGYKGRFALLEILEMHDNVRKVVLEGGNDVQIKREALENGMITLRRAAIRNILKGKTSIEETLRITTADERKAKGH
jgi:type IV pilus assembly protein PilB